MPFKWNKDEFSQHNRNIYPGKWKEDIANIGIKFFSNLNWLNIFKRNTRLFTRLTVRQYEINRIIITEPRYTHIEIRYVSSMTGIRTAYILRRTRLLGKVFFIAERHPYANISVYYLCGLQRRVRVK